VWYPWDKNDTHGKKTLSLKNLPSKHDQAANQATGEKDCTIFINKGDWLAVGTTNYAVPTTKHES